MGKSIHSVYESARCVVSPECLVPCAVIKTLTGPHKRRRHHQIGDDVLAELEMTGVNMGAVTVG